MILSTLYILYKFEKIGDGSIFLLWAYWTAGYDNLYTKQNTEK